MTMPLIMDNDNYMDDLFGDNDDPAPLTAPVISVKGLQTRIDELRTLGCCWQVHYHYTWLQWFTDDTNID